MYVITGASGNTGFRIAEALLSAGKSVTVVGRHADKLAPLVAKGATAAIGDLEDVAFLSRTLAGAKALYALIPPNFASPDFRAYQHRVADAFAEAIQDTGLKHVVVLSSIGAHLPEGNGVVQGLYYFEQKLSQIEGLNALYLRAGFFMENFLGSVGLVNVLNGLAGFPMKADLPMAMVHTQDIAAKATEKLLALDFTGKSVLDVAGPRDYTFTEAASIIGDAIGKPGLPWISFPYEQAHQAMMGNGLTKDLADLYIEFCQSANEGKLGGALQRNEANSTPTTLETFAHTFAAVYQSTAATA